MNRKLRSQKGFTLTELVVAIGISVMLMSVILVSQTQFSNSILLTNLAYDVALAARQAQVYGISVKEGSFLNFNQAAYGIHFDTRNPSSFVFFGDFDNNLSFSGSVVGSSCVPGTECLTLYLVSGGNTFAQVCGFYGTNSADCSSGPIQPGGVSPNGAIDTLDILFRRPNPEAIIRGYKNGVLVPTNYTGAAIVVASSGGNSRAVCVYYIGQISVKRHVNTNNVCG